MPVATVAGEPRRVEAQYGPDLPGTEPRHQPLEAGPRHHPAGGAAEVIIDHLDVAEAAAPRDIDELVPAPLALTASSACDRSSPTKERPAKLRPKSNQRSSSACGAHRMLTLP